MEKAILENKPEFVKFFMKVKNGIRLSDFLTHERLKKFYAGVRATYLMTLHMKHLN